MARAGEAFERWEEIERWLLEGKPLPEAARRYMLDAAQSVDLLARSKLQTEDAAKAILKAIALTGSDIAAYRTGLRDAWVDHLFKHWPDAKAETVAEEVAEIIGKKSGRTAFRRRKRSRS